MQYSALSRMLSWLLRPPCSSLFPYTTLFRSDRPDRLPAGDSASRHEQLARSFAHRLQTRAAAVGFQPHFIDMLFGMLRRHRSEEHTSELQSPCNLVCRHLLEKKNY